MGTGLNALLECHYEYSHLGYPHLFLLKSLVEVGRRRGYTVRTSNYVATITRK
jgi:hypothetical protein